MELFKQQWRTDRKTITGWTVALALLTWFTVSVYDYLVQSGVLDEIISALKDMPATLQAMIRSEAPLSEFGGYVAGAVLNYVAVLIIAIFVGLYVPNLLSREAEQRHLEFLLAQPIRRTALILSRWATLLTGLAAVHAGIWLTLVAYGGPDPQPVRYFWAVLNMLLLFLAVGTLILLVTVFVDDLSASTGISMALSLGLWFGSSFLESATGTLASLRKLLPFAYFDPGRIITGGEIPWGNLIGLAIAAIVLLALTIVAFDRKQIAA